MALNLLLVVLVIAAATCSCKSIGDEQRSVNRATSDSVNDALEQQLANAEPRQYFKVHVAPSQNKKRIPVKHTRSAAPADELAAQKSQSGEHKQKATISKQKINNATLKKLLSQSLLKPLNETAKTGSSSAKAPNFKFVFIQRATAPPSSQGDQSPAKKSTSTGRNGTSSQYAPSLAASVSKQLASTLSNSAVNIVGNLSSVPSLSSLASQIVQIIQTDGKQTTNDNKITTINSGSPSSTPLPVYPTPGVEQDIRRIQIGVDSSAAKKSGSSGSSKKNSGKSRPSKVYNLPVKFVSNGQPNHIVLNTIKQHFATIKKIQTVARLASQSQQGKRRKQSNGQKVKGNSRLIYLPLKYLSNARPNRIISSKATHKSTS